MADQQAQQQPQPTSIASTLFGASPATSVMGALGGIATALAGALTAKPGDGYLWAIAGLVMTLLGRLATDSAAGTKKSTLGYLLGSAPRSTLLSLAAPALAALVTFAQGQQGTGWYAIATFVPLIARFAHIPGLDGEKPAVSVITSALFVALLAGPALAQEATLDPSAASSPANSFVTIPAAPKLSYDFGGGWYLTGGVGLGGAALTRIDGEWRVVRNVQLAGLLEIGVPWKWANPVLGPAWQTGQSQGWGGTFGAVEKKTGANLALTASPVVVGGSVAWSFVGGTLIRY